MNVVDIEWFRVVVNSINWDVSHKCILCAHWTASKYHLHRSICFSCTGESEKIFTEWTINGLLSCTVIVIDSKKTCSKPYFHSLIFFYHPTLNIVGIVHKSSLPGLARYVLIFLEHFVCEVFAFISCCTGRTKFYKIQLREWIYIYIFSTDK